MAEPTRRLPDPALDKDGTLRGKSITTPEQLTTRGAIAVHSSRVIPVIFVPGVMGSNLRVTAAQGQAKNGALKTGAAAWRPPNGAIAGLKEAGKWKGRDPEVRQQILDPDTLDVDDRGEIDLSGDLFGNFTEQMRNRGWGEVHWDSYGDALCQLQRNLNHTFTYESYDRKRRVLAHWQDIIKYDRRHWDAPDMPALTEAELEKYARFHYPVYACGYNWLQSNEHSAERLTNRILDIIKLWSDGKHYSCKQVILVTHSMGGLVARACARKMPDRIVGVVHGAMPALGAPACYRRMACGTEDANPAFGGLWDSPLKTKKRIAMGKVADIVGRRPDDTMPVMAVAPGALELLPNHLYPGPWLFASTRQAHGHIEDVLELPKGNPYDLYRDTDSWYRVIDPALCDPAKKYKANSRGGINEKIAKAIAQAEKFHTRILDTYYHPNTYAFYGADEEYLSFGAFRWITSGDTGGLLAQQSQKLHAAAPVSYTFDGGRNVQIDLAAPYTGRVMYFEPSVQDVKGDGTVSHQSGAGPKGHIRRTFRTTGYDHQGAYGNEHMLALTQHLIVKIAQDAT